MAVNINPKKACVVDASYLLAFFLPDEANEEGDQFFDAVKETDIKIHAPELIVYEIGNALAMAVRRKRLTLEQAEKIMSNFLKLNINIIPINEMETLRLSATEKITYYDGGYLYLSKYLNISLMSADKKLSKLASRA